MAASGGMAQYELNGLVLKFRDEADFSLPDIDAWISTIKLPSGMTPMPKQFFETRVVDNYNAHINAFASEVLTAVVLLVLHDFELVLLVFGLVVGF